MNVSENTFLCPMCKKHSVKMPDILGSSSLESVIVQKDALWIFVKGENEGPPKQKPLCLLCSKKMSICLFCEYWNRPAQEGNFLSEASLCFYDPLFQYKDVKKYARSKCSKFTLLPLIFTENQLYRLLKRGIRVVKESWFGDIDRFYNVGEWK